MSPHTASDTASDTKLENALIKSARINNALGRANDIYLLSLLRDTTMTELDDDLLFNVPIRNMTRHILGDQQSMLRVLVYALIIIPDDRFLTIAADDLR